MIRLLTGTSTISPFFIKKAFSWYWRYCTPNKETNRRPRSIRLALISLLRGWYSRENASRVTIRLTSANFPTSSAVETSSKTSSSESRYRHFMWKYVTLFAVVFSSPMSNRKHKGFSMSRQVVYTIVFGLKRTQSRSYVISSFFRSGIRRLVVETYLLLMKFISRLRCFSSSASWSTSSLNLFRYAFNSER